MTSSAPLSTSGTVSSPRDMSSQPTRMKLIRLRAAPSAQQTEPRFHRLNHPASRAGLSGVKYDAPKF
jgi:hypothetical protein